MCHIQLLLLFVLNLLSLSLSLPPPSLPASLPYYIAAVVEHFASPQASHFPLSVQEANEIVYQNLLTYEQRILCLHLALFLIDISYPPILILSSFHTLVSRHNPFVVTSCTSLTLLSYHEETTFSCSAICSYPHLPCQVPVLPFSPSTPSYLDPSQIY